MVPKLTFLAEIAFQAVSVPAFAKYLILDLCGP